MALITRRAFVSAAAVGACTAAVATRQARAAGLLSSLLGDVAQAARDASADGEVPTGGSEGPDSSDSENTADSANSAWASLTDDQTAAVLLRAFVDFDFATVLDRCAVEDYLRSGGWILSSLCQLSDQAFVAWSVDWDDFPLHIDGTLLAVMAAQLRGHYAADIMRSVAGIVADVAGIDIMSMELDDRVGNATRQLLELDAALSAFDASALIEVLDVKKSTSVADCLQMDWLDPAYEVFELGREAAALLDGEPDPATSVYRCTLGYKGQPAIVVTLPLVRYQTGWQLQRPCWYTTLTSSFVSYAWDADPSEGVYSVSDIALPEVERPREDPIEQEPFASIDDASDSLLAALGYTGNPGEKAFERLFCAEEYLGQVDLAHVFDIERDDLAHQIGYIDLGSIGSFFMAGRAFLPVVEPRFRPLAAACYVNAFGAQQMLSIAARAAQTALRDSGRYDRVYLDVLDAFSPCPTTVNPTSLCNYPNAVLGSNATTEQVEAFAESFYADFPFQMVADYLIALSSFWDDLGTPVATYVAGDPTSTADMASIANLFGGQAKAVHVIFHKADPSSGAGGHVYKALHTAVAPCGQGWRVADIEFLSLRSEVLPVRAIYGIDSLEGVDPDDGMAELRRAQEQGLIEGLRDLR